MEESQLSQASSQFGGRLPKKDKQGKWKAVSSLYDDQSLDLTACTADFTYFNCAVVKSSYNLPN